MFRNFQGWMETAVASLAKQAARRISAPIKDSDGTNEESEGLAKMFFTHVQLVRVERDLGNEDRASGISVFGMLGSTTNTVQTCDIVVF